MVEAYTDKIFDPVSERERLNDPFPAEVSSRHLQMVLSKTDRNLSVLDVASGPIPYIARLVNDFGGVYYGLDKDPHGTHLGNLQDGGVERLVKGDALLLPMADGTVDISHTRIFLAFFDKLRRGEVIKEVLRVTRSHAIFIEHDYANTESWVGVNSEFRSVMLDILNHIGFDTNCGRKLEGDVKTSLEELERDANIETELVAREPGNYYDELLGRAEELLGVANKLDWEEETSRLQSIIEQLQSQERSKLPDFRTPDLQVVTVSF